LPKGISIYFLSEQGFGHSIMQADVFLEYVDPNGYIILLLSQKRHNNYVKLLYGSNYRTLKSSYTNSSFDGDYRLDRLIVRLSRVILGISKKQKLYCWTDLLRLSERINTQNYLEYPGTSFAVHKLWYLTKSSNMVVDKAYSFTSSSDYLLFKKYVVQSARQSRFAALYIRDKPDDNRISFLRSGKSLMKSLHIIDFLNKNGFTVLIYGEISPIDFNKLVGSDVLCWVNSNISKSLWDIFAPVFSEFVVGPSGGGLQIPIKVNKPILALDTFGFWNGFPNSLLAYKIVKDENGQIVNPEKYFRNTPFETNFQGLIVESIPDDLDLKILEEFLQVLQFWTPKQKITQTFHPGCALTFSPYSRISNSYLSYVGMS